MLYGSCCECPFPLLEAIWCDFNEANYFDVVGPSSDLLEPSCLRSHIHPVSWYTLASDRSVVAKSQLLARIWNRVAAQDEKIFWREGVFSLNKRRYCV